MSSRPTRVVSVGVLSCALVLTGCATGTPDPSAGSSSSTTSSTSTAISTSASAPEGRTTAASAAPGAESAGDEVSGRSGGFTVVPPEGWTEATDRAGSVTGIDLVLLSSRKVGGFANNLVVIASEGDQATVDDQLAQGKEQMVAAGRTISPAADKDIAGATATGFTTAFQQQGVKVLARSYGVKHGGRIYLLTLSSSQQDAGHAMAEFDELLSTWAWT